MPTRPPWPAPPEPTATSLVLTGAGSIAIVSLGRAAGGLRVLLQRVPERGGDKNAVHPDLETDAPEAEVARLTAIGASRERPLGHGAWVLQDPAGNRFCVIYPETPGWPRGTKELAGPTPTGP